jgi:hypothetical protein
MKMMVSKLFANFGPDALGPPVWEPGPSFQRGHAGAPKMAQPAPRPSINLGAPVEMLSKTLRDKEVPLSSPETGHVRMASATCL